MKKVLLLLLLISSMFGYLEWGNGRYGFIWQEESTILRKAITDPAAFLHPFILLPMLGQLLLVIAFFRYRAERWMVFSGIAALSVLYILLLVIGLISSNAAITGFSLPFILLSMLTIRVYVKNN